MDWFVMLQERADFEETRELEIGRMLALSPLKSASLKRPRPHYEFLILSTKIVRLSALTKRESK